MNQKALKVLEYSKIKDMLRAQCSSSITMEEAESLLPSCDINRIRRGLQETDEAVVVLLKKGAPPLGNFHDVSGLAHLAAKGGCLMPKQLLELAYDLGCSRRTRSFLSSDLPELPYIDDLVSAITVLKSLEDEIKRCIISEDEIADSASVKLAAIRRSIARKNDAIKAKIAQIIGSSSTQQYLQDSLVTMRQGRYVIPVKQEHKARIPGIVHDQSASGATLFIEPQAVVTMNNELRELELEEQQEIQRILAELSASAGAAEAPIRGNQQILQKLDMVFAKGRLACNMNAMKPEISTDGKLYIRRGRHPLIDPKKVRPIDVAIGESYDTLVITGPNTGGKTVTLKLVGLLCLMAQSGLFVPASDGTVLPVYKDIFADIGDEQSIEQSLSTFSSHMVNIVNIVENAGPDCLVLLDELGAGTDPAEGASLAMAVLDHLYGKGASTIATTHYTELKKYAISTYGVQNASMEFDVATLSPTYRLVIGLPGKSNAFEISQKLGMPADVLDHAKSLLDTGAIAFEDVISSIEADKKAAEEQLRSAAALKTQMEAQKARMEDLERRYEDQKIMLLEEAREEAQQLLEKANQDVLAMQAELSEARKALDDAQSEAAARELNKKLENAKKSIKDKKRSNTVRRKAAANPDQPEPEDIRPGIRVNVLSVDQKGQVLSAPDDKGDFMVQVGSLKLGVNVKDVTLVVENVSRTQKAKARYSSLYREKSQTVAMSVNVIGKTLDEAQAITDKYLDDAFMAGLETVTVIHGKGTGTLRQGLQAMFRKHKHVKAFRTASYAEGGEGATIVELKK